jgi:hypothetical protein
VAKAVKPKKRCCSSRPRCKRCPVVLKRLRKQGLAERDENGRYTVSPELKKKQLRQARR